MVCKYLLLSCGNLDEGCKGTLIEADQRPIVRRAVALLQPSGSQQLPNKMTGKSTTLIMTIMTPMVFLVTMPILLITTVMMTDMMMTAIMAALALSMLLMMLEMSALIRPRRFFFPCARTPADNGRARQRGRPRRPSNLRHLAVRHPLPTSCLFAGPWKPL